MYAEQCPCRTLLDLLANKWSALAIGALEDGPQRFGQLQRHLQGISPKVLTQNLRRLEEFGLVERTIYPVVPLHVEYALTELGHSAAAPLRMLRNWVENNIDSVALAGAREASCASETDGFADP
ncbi:winged helix-turn-helix transcriptional regulator, partial [Nocardia fusca]|uniref:winged helix-turn-helix transcriptional regulator n=1 Tax=Nocardia fusca TaxID=941183 RepID=UPI0007A748DD